MSAVGISAAISLDKSALIEYSVPERSWLVSPLPVPLRLNKLWRKPAMAFHNNIRNWLVTKAAAVAANSEAATLSVLFSHKTTICKTFYC